MEYYQLIRTKNQGKFMAYKQEFLDKNYTYIRSVRMFAFHIAMMIVDHRASAFGQLFPGNIRKKKMIASTYL